MFSVKPLTKESRTVAIIRDLDTEKIVQTIWLTEPTRKDKKFVKDNDFYKDAEKYVDKRGHIKDDERYQFEMVPHSRVTTQFPRFVNYYVAKSNSGKSYNIARYCTQYLQQFPKNTIVYVSPNPIDNDVNYRQARSFLDEKGEPRLKSLDVNKQEQMIDFTEFRDVLFVFDDCDFGFSTGMDDLDERLTPEELEKLTITEKSKVRNILEKRNKNIVSLINQSITSLIFGGRKNNISVITVGHKYNSGYMQKSILCDASGVVLFPAGPKGDLEPFLKTKLSLSKEGIDEIMNIKWFKYDFAFINTAGFPFLLTADRIKFL